MSELVLLAVGVVAAMGSSRVTVNFFPLVKVALENMDINSCVSLSDGHFNVRFLSVSSIVTSAFPLVMVAMCFNFSSSHVHPATCEVQIFGVAFGGVGGGGRAYW